MIQIVGYYCHIVFHILQVLGLTIAKNIVVQILTISKYCDNISSSS